MKKLLLLIALFSTFTVFSQVDSSKKQHRHELGVDITGLLNQFLNFSPYGYGSRNAPNYLFSYRYYFKKSNIRFGIGGKYSKIPNILDFDGNHFVYYNTQSNFSVRIGYEFVNQLSKRWQMFYGFDFRPGISKFDYLTPSNQGYFDMYKEDAITYGFAPLMGFRFTLNDRISLITEASFTYFTRKSSRQEYTFSEDPILYPVNSNPINKRVREVGASFDQPIFITLAVRL
jgi:hypothetical protein